MLAISIGMALYLVVASNRMTTIQEQHERDFNSLKVKFERVATNQYKFRETIMAHFDIGRAGSRGATSQITDRANK